MSELYQKAFKEYLNREKLLGETLSDFEVTVEVGNILKNYLEKGASLEDVTKASENNLIKKVDEMRKRYAQ